MTQYEISCKRPLCSTGDFQCLGSSHAQAGSDFTNFCRKSVSKPDIHAVLLWLLLQCCLDMPACEINRAVAITICLEALTVGSRQKQRDSTVVPGRVIPCLIFDPVSGHVLKSPVGDRLLLFDCTTVEGGRFDRCFSFFPGNLFQQSQQGFDNQRFGFRNKTRCSCWPRGVTSKQMLFRRRDVTSGSIGEFKIEGRRQWTLSLEFQTGDPVHLVGNRRDSQLADSHSLQNDLGNRVFLNPFGLLSVDFRAISGWQVTSSCVQGTRPLQTIP